MGMYLRGKLMFEDSLSITRNLQTALPYKFYRNIFVVYYYIEWEADTLYIICRYVKLLVDAALLSNW